MAKRRIIAGFFFSLLLVFVSNNLPFEVYTSYAHGNLAIRSFIVKNNSASSRSDLSINKTTVKKDHVKVRYMGGECGHNVVVFFADNNVPSFIEKADAIPHLSFVSSCCYSLFKLRGPPTVRSFSVAV